MPSPLPPGPNGRHSSHPSDQGPHAAEQSLIEDATLDAYRETLYRVGGETPFTMRIGVECPELAALHHQHGLSSSCFITAYNPLSQQLTDTENEARHNELCEDAAVQCRPHIEGIGEHPTNGWPGERSLLVLGLDLDTARELGNRWGQNAIVWSGRDAVPQLTMLR